MRRKKIVFTVTNDLSFDQRMIRICTSLAENGYEVLLVGRLLRNSRELQSYSFEQFRIRCLFTKGMLFYAEYNVRLFVFLLRYRFDVIGAIDLDTILPCLLVSLLRKKIRIYDAHELFCEMKEISSRPLVHKCWKLIEKITVPRFKLGYTVNQPIADEFKRMYSVQYEIIRNMPVYKNIAIPTKPSKFLLYQGAVNEGRSFETLIPAMKMVDSTLVICGQGNFLEEAKRLVKEHQLETKIIFKGTLVPEELRLFTAQAWAGVTLFDRDGLSNYYSLANRFSDYIQAGLPQICVDYPVYRELNNLHEVAVLISDLSESSIADALNRLLNDQELYQKLQSNCLVARETLSWQEEEKKLIRFYQTHIG